MTAPDELLARLDEYKRNERHHNLAEIMHWFHQYKMLSEDCIATIRSLLAQLEAERTAREEAEQREELHYNRLAGILFSGRMDSVTAGEFQQVAKEYVDWKHCASAAEARAAQVEQLLQRWIDYHTKAAGMTPEIVLDKDKFQAFLDNVECKEAELLNETIRALAAPDLSPAHAWPDLMKKAE